eukprot:CAMPEP_0181362832 /NCGR_PEP_ID=MMETSP1106-20121128/8299_1 /TAXON_ID=81844 /ORGANISM="Mantoniella antarctica, Strain SL-175" /LENGTH=55 /DNA_ID=CAMNT_0023476977 /DNA_START=58 /DNA_END=222 /DNA_ORIENTATION=+
MYIDPHMGPSQRRPKGCVPSAVFAIGLRGAGDGGRLEGHRRLHEHTAVDGGAGDE